MGCADCAARAAILRNSSKMVRNNYRAEQSTEPCEYTVEMLRDYEEKLVWFKNKGLHLKNNISPKTLNSYIGIVLTSLNVGNKCVYRDTLAKIKDLVDLIVILQG